MTVPIFIFLDELDVMLSSRGSHGVNTFYSMEANEILQQMQGIVRESNVRVLSATNLPRKLDKAALRRFPVKLWFGPPVKSERLQCLQKLLRSKDLVSTITPECIETAAEMLVGSSYSQLTDVVRFASMIPVKKQAFHSVKDVVVKDCHLLQAALEFQVKPDIFPKGYGEMYEWVLTHWKEP